MELLRGGTLQDRLAGGPVPPRFAMRVCAEVAAALAAAHADGLVHRDIKPANVMVTPDGVKVVDFGIAAAIGSARPSDGEVIGTPAYVAPERLIDDAVQPASDVYALGVLLYRLLSGHAPWSADTTTQMLSAHIYVEPEPLAPLPEVPDYVTAAVQSVPAQGSDRSARARGRRRRCWPAGPACAWSRTSRARPTRAGPTRNRRSSSGHRRNAADGVPGDGTPGCGLTTCPTAVGGRIAPPRAAGRVGAMLAVAGVLAALFLPDDPRGTGPRGATGRGPARRRGHLAVSASPSPAGTRRRRGRPPPRRGPDAGRTAGPAPAGTPIGTAGPSTVPIGRHPLGQPGTAAAYPHEPVPTATATRPPDGADAGVGRRNGTRHLPGAGHRAPAFLDA
jgi:serine/threonine-protein kinase